MSEIRLASWLLALQPPLLLLLQPGTVTPSFGQAECPAGGLALAPLRFERPNPQAETVNFRGKYALDQPLLDG